MRTWTCTCGNQLFYDNTLCLACGAEAGWCPACEGIVRLLPAQGDLFAWQCGNPACGVFLNKCHNYAVEFVCNRMVMDARLQLCDCCRYNRTIPDLSVEGNREKWAQLEKAKRRLFFTLDILGLPHGTAEEGFELPLSFSFMSDERPDEGLWRSFYGGKVKKVYTGHDRGHITINIQEGDEVERERLRVDLNESHRTLIGHFRHEIGHYYWELLVKGKQEAECIAVFGDHNEPPYAEALEAYYRDGARPDWPDYFISAYAAMHPWEDFAETFAFYLDMVSVLDTTLNFGMRRSSHDGSLQGMLEAYRRVGLVVNEVNREMGLLDLVPETPTPAIENKLAFVHRVIAG